VSSAEVARPQVSVAMLTYNHERFVQQALTSVLDQDMSDIEVVVGDDASTDNTPALLRDLAADASSPVNLILRTENIGAQRNFADVWRRCRGRYIAILEGDDYWCDTAKLAKQTDLMDRDQSVALSFHRVDAVDAEGTSRGESWPPDRNQTQFTLRDLARQNSIQTCSVMYRAGIVRQLPEWFEDLIMNDWPLHLLHAARGNVAYLPDTMAAYRFHPGGLWSGRPAGRRLLESARTLLVVADRGDPTPTVKHWLIATARRMEGLALGASLRRGDRAGAREALRLLTTQRPTKRPIDAVTT
jgi:glycosyltransferase involved in cell wall biosynthesis